MTVVSEIAGRALGLPRARTREVVVERDLSVAMPDGATLLADRYVARDAAAAAGAPPPTVLVRTPYGRRGVFGLLYGRLLAERGFQVVVQSVRGTFGSGGEFSPFEEQADGLATLDWLARQPWHRGPVGMIGPSYLGIVQWAVAGRADGRIGALAPSITASRVHPQGYGGGSLMLGSTLAWTVIVAAQERRLGPLRIAQGLRRLPAAFDHLPLEDVDVLATGAAVPFVRDWFDHTELEDPYWTARDFAADVADVTAPVQLVGGWQDVFLPWMIDDYLALRRAGRTAQLVVGPGAHTSAPLLALGLREGLAWLRAQLLDDRRLLREAPVRVWVGGAERWRELPEWPPPDGRPWRLHLQPGRGLAEATPPPDGAPGRFRYDPADPTPAVGGPVLLTRAPVQDNRALEARPDVLVHTGAPLADDVEAIGPVRAEVHVRTSSPHADVFVRVCDVEPAADGAPGRSLNVCDALVRLAPDAPAADGDGVRRVALELWPTAHRFRRGHRIRVLLAGGAHPRYARNLGTGEPLATATRMVAVDCELLHDGAHPSWVELTVVPAGG